MYPSNTAPPTAPACTAKLSPVNPYLFASTNNK